MEVLKGISSFKRPIRRACVGAGTGHSGPGSRQRTAAPPRPGHGLWGYMQPALASASVEVAQTSGGCDSRRPGPGRRNRAPRLALGARQPAATSGAGTTALVPPPPPPPPRTTGRRSGPRGSSVICGQRLNKRPIFSFFQNKLLMCLVAASFSQHLRLVMSGSRRGRFSWQL